jgi:hypothetical protein
MQTTPTSDTSTTDATAEIRSKSAKGMLVSADAGTILWRPLDTSYEHQLEFAGDLSSQIGRHVRGRVKVRGRKVYSVSSGGNFVQPILGTPRIIQGRVLALEGNVLFVKAGAVFAVELPTGKDTIDLASGGVSINSMVNVVAWPGAAFEVI